MNTGPKVVMSIITAMLLAGNGYFWFSARQQRQNARQMGMELSEASVQLEDLRGHNERFKDRNRDLTAALDAVQSRLTDLEQVVPRLAATQKALAVAKSNGERLASEVEQQRRIANRSRPLIEECRQSVENAHRRFEELQKSSAGELADLNTLMAHQIDSRRNLSKQLQKATQELEDCVSLRTATDRKSDRLRQALSTRQAVLLDLEKDLAAAENRYGHLKEKLTAVNHQNTLLLEKLSANQANNRLLDQRIAGLEQDRQGSRRKIADLEQAHATLISDLKQQLASREAAIRTINETISITFLDRILFGFGSTRLTPSGKEVLRKVGAILADIRDKRIRIVGHTDPVPIAREFRFRFPSNWELSAARAATVVRFLASEKGVAPARMEAVGMSSYQPLNANRTPSDHARNRRVEIIIFPDMGKVTREVSPSGQPAAPLSG